MDELYEVLLDKLKEKYGEPKVFEHKNVGHSEYKVSYVWREIYSNISFNINEILFLIKKENTGVTCHFQINFERKKWYGYTEKTDFIEEFFYFEWRVIKKKKSFLINKFNIKKQDILEYLSQC